MARSKQQLVRDRRSIRGLEYARLLGWSLYACLLACTPLKPGDVLPDSGPKSDASEPAADVCKHVLPPEAPAAAESTSSRESDYVFVLRTSDVGDYPDSDGKPRYQSLGYDLDGTCTGQGFSCVSPRGQTSPVQDESEGRDNSLNSLLFKAAGLPLNHAQQPFYDVDMDAQVGRASIAIVIRGYNGEANDTQIEVGVYSVSMWADVFAGSPAPRWDGDDVWRPTSPWIDPTGDGPLRSDRPLFRDAHAYVSDGTFVARFSSLLLGFAYIPSDLWHDVLVTGRLYVRDGELEVREGILTGMWPVDTLLTFLARPFEADPNSTACVEVNALMRDLFCNSVDLSISEDPNAPCDAISIVYGFTASRARLGDPIALGPIFHPHCDVLDCNEQPL
jgi:hypothetical protein